MFASADNGGCAMLFSRYFCLLIVVFSLLMSSISAMDLERGVIVPEKCPICLEVLPNKGSKVICGDLLFGCSSGHAFHVDCMIGWIKSRAQDNLDVTCPVCRALAQRPLNTTIPACIRQAFEPERHPSCEAKTVSMLFVLSGFGLFAYAMFVINNMV
jgi:hypothetical protein